MQDKDLPGYCSAHWVLFVTALCCGGSEPVTHGGIGAARDRSRIEKLYDIKQYVQPFSSICSAQVRDRLEADGRTDYAFGNVARSRRVYREVWRQNQGGRIFVDWVDVLTERDWELFLV
jgi:transcriptional activator protein UGA3